ncbi:MAG: metallophosphoesterase [Bacteroidales bacterium]|nr:metallophosphoesterase [Bacteroidales bacterium]
MKRQIFLIIMLTGSIFYGCHAQIKLPKVYSNMGLEYENVFLVRDEAKIYNVDLPADHTLAQMLGSPVGTERGIVFDFQDSTLEGTLYYGLIHYDDSKHPLPVFFRNISTIVRGKSQITIDDVLSGMYDMIGWEKSGEGTIGYRVIDSQGNMIYDGRVAFKGTGPFEIGITVTEGPFVNLLTEEGATITFKTNTEIVATVKVDGRSFVDQKATTEHAIGITGLSPDTEYEYVLQTGGIEQQYAFRTAPVPGSRTPFTFAYASDSRSGQGGGERDIYGVNSYIMKKIMAATVMHGARFFQFTGDLINGYLTSKEATNLQYANWKRSIEAFAHYMPVYVGMGNHEALEFWFYDERDERVMKVDRFPFATESAEAVFMDNFYMPMNGPESEDGAVYDPNPLRTDFPSYKESVFYYIYDNVAVVVLNSDYFYASSTPFIRLTSGNLHGYIMDMQLKWLASTLQTLEADERIDHIFVTQHTPAFPNGGHVGDDMWYSGNNQYRPYIAGRPLGKGIIERRDEYLDLVVNKSNKVLAIFTGDEHNYNRLKISSDMTIYPEMYFNEKIEIGREVWQINNGAAGAPYYAQEETPWSSHVQGFTTQHALVLIHVDGQKVTLEVINPDTLELIDEAVLKE